VCPHAQPGCSTRGTPPAVAKQLHGLRTNLSEPWWRPELARVMHVFEGAAEALEPVRTKLSRREPIVVAAVGGSITAGAMLAGQPTYMELFRDWLQWRFPTAADGGNHTYVNLGYHAHDSQVRCNLAMHCGLQETRARSPYAIAPLVLPPFCPNPQLASPNPDIVATSTRPRACVLAHTHTARKDPIFLLYYARTPRR